MRVVFMGTPDIAATCLTKILEDGFEVVGYEVNVCIVVLSCFILCLC